MALAKHSCLPWNLLILCLLAMCVPELIIKSVYARATVGPSCNISLEGSSRRTIEIKPAGGLGVHFIVNVYPAAIVDPGVFGAVNTSKPVTCAIVGNTWANKTTRTANTYRNL
jgi:hypothetical protein